MPSAGFHVFSCCLSLKIPASFMPCIHSWLLHQCKNWNVTCVFTWKTKDEPFFMVILVTGDRAFHSTALCGLPPKAWQLKLLVSDFKDRVQQRVCGRCLKRNRWWWDRVKWYHFNLLQYWCQQKYSEIITCFTKSVSFGLHYLSAKSLLDLPTDLIFQFMYSCRLNTNQCWDILLFFPTWAVLNHVFKQLEQFLETFFPLPGYLQILYFQSLLDWEGSAQKKRRAWSISEPFSCESR